jgi:hypothetical protein
MGAAERVDVHMHVFLRESEKERTIFQRGFHRKLKDQTRRSIPDASGRLVLDSALTDRIGRVEEIAPATFTRSNEASAPLVESRRTRLRDRRAPTACHVAIVAGRTQSAQLKGERRARERGARDVSATELRAAR